MPVLTQTAVESVAQAVSKTGNTKGLEYTRKLVNIRKAHSSPKCTAIYSLGKKCKLSCIRITRHKKPDETISKVEYTSHCYQHGGRQEKSAVLRRKAQALASKSKGTLKGKLALAVGLTSNTSIVSVGSSPVSTASTVIPSSENNQSTPHTSSSQNTNPKVGETSLYKPLRGTSLPTQQNGVPSEKDPVHQTGTSPPTTNNNNNPGTPTSQPGTLPEKGGTSVTSGVPVVENNIPSNANLPAGQVPVDNANLPVEHLPAPVENIDPDNPLLDREPEGNLYTIHDKTLGKYFQKKLKHGRATTLSEELALIRTLIQKLVNTLDITDHKQVNQLRGLIRDADRLAKTVDRLESTRHIQYSRESLKMDVMKVCRAIKEEVSDPNVKAKIAQRLANILSPALTETGDIEITRETFSASR